MVLAAPSGRLVGPGAPGSTAGGPGEVVRAAAAGGREEEDVLVAIGPHSRSFGRFRLFVVRCPLSEREGLFCFRWLDVPLVLELEKCQICRNSMKGKVDSCL